MIKISGKTIRMTKGDTLEVPVIIMTKNGEVYIPGPQGPKGEKGDRVETDETGPAGPTGERGEKGNKGDKGDPGDDYILTQQDKEDIAGLVNIPLNDDRPFKTVNEITITEETTDFYVDTDNEGNPLALKEAVVIFTRMTATGNGGGFLFLAVNNDTMVHSINAKPFVNISNVYYSTAVNCMAHMWISGGRFFGNSMYSTSKNYTRVGVNSNMNAFGVIECNAIKSLHMYSPNGHKLTGGTVTIIGR